jgi:3'-5' exoribonuclease
MTRLRSHLGASAGLDIRWARPLRYGEVIPGSRVQETGGQELAIYDDSSDVGLLRDRTKIRYIRDLVDGNAVDQVLLLRDSELRHTRTGADFMRLALADRTGVIAGLVWDDVEHASATARPGAPVRVVGKFSQHPRFGRQLTVETLDIPLEVDWDRLLDGPATPVGELEHQLGALFESLREPHLVALMDALLGGGSQSGLEFRRAFAAQYNHHAYRSGLLEHSLAVAQATAAAAQIFPGIDRDLAVCGALLHDIGKLNAYSGDEHAVELNDAGKLIGEIPSGYFTVRRCIEDTPGFPPSLAKSLLHIILSHHGCLEHGSPVLPATREAMLVHTMDKLSGDLGSFDRLARETRDDDRWSRYDRTLGRCVFLADISEGPAL